MFEIVEREHPITVRGCFYRAVSAGIYPGTQDKYYQKCVKLLQEMRTEDPGRNDIPYEWIIDSSRSRRGSGGYSGLESFLESIPHRYGRNYWLDQPRQVEVMTEKDAMSTILRPIINKWNVPFTVFRGNPSDTMCYDLGKSFKQFKEDEENEDDEYSELRRLGIKLANEAYGRNKEIVVLYLGDFDPSGLNISRVARRKVERFADRKIKWVRVAINRTQFERMQEQFGISVKGGDKLAPAYVRKYGRFCVEVDAIPSDEVRQLLENSIVKRIDIDVWKQSETIEKGEQEELKRLVSKMK